MIGSRYGIAGFLDELVRRPAKDHLLQLRRAWRTQEERRDHPLLKPDMREL
jgi:hypothetical protein